MSININDFSTDGNVLLYKDEVIAYLKDCPSIGRVQWCEEDIIELKNRVTELEQLLAER